MNRGDIILCDFGDPMGHEPGFRHPALVISPTMINQHGVLIVVPITKTRRGYPTHVELEGVLPVTSYAQCELVRSVSSQRVVRSLARADEAIMWQVSTVLRRILEL